MQSLQHRIKVRGGRGASSSSPYRASAKSNAKLQEVRVQTPWGKGCTLNQMHATSLLVEVDLLAHEHPAFHPRPMYYNVQQAQ